MGERQVAGEKCIPDCGNGAGEDPVEVAGQLGMCEIRREVDNSIGEDFENFEEELGDHNS